MMHSLGQFNNVYEGNNYYSLNNNFRLIGRQVEVCFESGEIPPPAGHVINRRVFQRFILKWIIPLLLSLEGEWGGYWCICFVSLKFSSALPHLQNAVKTHSFDLQHRNRCTVLVAELFAAGRQCVVDEADEGDDVENHKHLMNTLTHSWEENDILLLFLSPAYIRSRP